MVEFIAYAEWILKNIFGVGGSDTRLEGIGKHLKRWKGEGIETENIRNIKELQ